jgi:hypothetical protein
MLSLSLREATFSTGFLGGTAKMMLMDTDSLLVSLRDIQDLSTEPHTIKNIDKLIDMIHELHLKY